MECCLKNYKLSCVFINLLVNVNIKQVNIHTYILLKKSLPVIKFPCTESSVSKEREDNSEGIEHSAIVLFDKSSEIRSVKRPS